MVWNAVHIYEHTLAAMSLSLSLTRSLSLSLSLCFSIHIGSLILILHPVRNTIQYGYQWPAIHTTTDLQIGSECGRGDTISAFGVWGWRNDKLDNRRARQSRPFTYIILQPLRLLFRFERHETVALADARPIDDDLCGLDVPVRREHAAQLRLGGVAAAQRE